MHTFVFVLSTILSYSTPGRAEDSKPALKVESVGYTVRDLSRAVEFFTRVLTFEKVDEREETGDAFARSTGVLGSRARITRLKLGEETMELTQFLAPQGRSIPADSRSNDRWFQHIAIIVHDMDNAYRHLRKHNIQQVSPEPQLLPDWNKNAGGIKAFYFKDSEGHILEILQFPAGKGDARWHKRTEKLFLGIDHTAIVVRETEASLQFYRDKLGLKIVGESVNSGPEQERLSNVVGARLRITTLKGASGPAIELLEYLSPRDGRSLPADTKVNDVWYWQVRWRNNLPTIDESSPSRSHTGAKSQTSNNQTLRVDHVKDPDGHAHVIPRLRTN